MGLFPMKSLRSGGWTNKVECRCKLDRKRGLGGGVVVFSVFSCFVVVL